MGELPFNTIDRVSHHKDQKSSIMRICTVTVDDMLYLASSGCHRPLTCVILFILMNMLQITIFNSYIELLNDHPTKSHKPSETDDKGRKIESDV